MRLKKFFEGHVHREDITEVNFTDVGCEIGDCIQLGQDRVQWQTFWTLQLSFMFQDEEFLYQMREYQLLKNGTTS
jgi:hypothetical protein